MISAWQIRLSSQQVRRKTGEYFDISCGLNSHICSDALESASQPTHTFPQDRQELLRHLEKTNPESLALARDWDDTAWSLVKAQTKLKKYDAYTFFFQISR